MLRDDINILDNILSAFSATMGSLPWVPTSLSVYWKKTPFFRFVWLYGQMILMGAEFYSVLLGVLSVIVFDIVTLKWSSKEELSDYCFFI